MNLKEYYMFRNCLNKGEAFFEVIKDEKNKEVHFNELPLSTMYVTKDINGSVIEYSQRIDGRVIYFKPQDIMHLRLEDLLHVVF